MMTNRPAPAEGNRNDFHILYQDDDVVAIVKPAGITVHRNARSTHGETFVLQRLSAQLDIHLYPVHRIDRNTSGVLFFALRRPVAAPLQAALGDDDSVKEYLTLARGTPPEAFESTRPLRNDHGEPVPCRSEFTRLEVFPRAALLRVRIWSGRHHQIRRHLNHLGHHVVGDTTHGKGDVNRHYREHHGLPRMFLHAERTVIAHPVTRARLEVTCALPEDLAAVLVSLRASATDD